MERRGGVWGASSGTHLWWGRVIDVVVELADLNLDTTADGLIGSFDIDDNTPLRRGLSASEIFALSVHARH